MCGIVGYTGPRQAGPILMEGLRRLEYRGYDSAGIALVDERGDLFVEKRAGKLSNLATAIAERTPRAAVGLAHNEACDSSVMPTWGFCRNNGTPRRTTVGPHDAEDRYAYWNSETPLYPVLNKCWTNEDADGDGVCDRFGPPILVPPADLPQEARPEGVGTAPVEAPPKPVK